MNARIEQCTGTRAVLSSAAALLWAVLVSGCGSDSGHAAFLGTWHVDLAEKASLVCGDRTPLDFNPEGQDKVFKDGIAYPIVDTSSTFDGTNCNFGFDVAGAEATMHPDQTCNLSNPVLALDPANPVQLIPSVSPAPWRFTLVGQNRAEEVGVALVTHFPFPDPNDPTGMTAVLFDCTYTVRTTLTRVATD